MRDPYVVATIDQRRAEALELLRSDDSFLLLTVTADGVEVAAALDITPQEYLKLAEAVAVVVEQVGQEMLAGMVGELERSE